jgi:arabinose-5-phosphate isomerase
LEKIILDTAFQTIDIEINSLLALKNELGKDFVDAVNVIFNSKGRLVVTGIGKSAIVAQKIVATMNSTGTPALYMHAADAIHGDLGMIQTHDVVICISKSGDTPEIQALVPFLKNFGTALIAMVSNLNSVLAKQANFILHTPIDQEADPNNLAPTASTTAQMAMGDALATSLLALRGFSSQDFAQFHPGGALGKQLYLRVSDIFPLHEQPNVLPKTSISATIVEMTSKRRGATAVVDEHKKVLGIITDGDLRRMLEKFTALENLVAQDIMTKNAVNIHPNAMAVEAMELMRKKNISQLIVAEDGLYVGLIHLHDLLKEGLI